MKILLGTHYLAKTGGTECYTYALAMELQRLGHDVEYYTEEPGYVSWRLASAGIKPKQSNHYDLILANHTTVVAHLCGSGPIIQTCHGATAELEQPSAFADIHVAVSDEVAKHLEKLGFQSAAIIHNGIDCVRFFPKKPVSDKLQTVLSLCQGAEAHEFVRRCCDRAGYKFLRADKKTDDVWFIEDLICQSDLVVGLGRSVYDAMACGRCALVYDKRDNIGHFMGDGMIMQETIQKALTCNCNGKANKFVYSEDEFIAEMRKFSPHIAKWSRGFAVTNLNIRNVAERYLQLYREKLHR